VSQFPGVVSVLDVGPVWSGSSATQALRNTLDLAPKVERLGYTRYWIAEHHNTPCLATTATAVLVGQVAAATSTMRVGSGGVLLPNHPPLVVAEQFGILEALYPGRIDLGIGRAPGTDALTSVALRRTPTDSPEDFARQLDELMGYFTPTGPDRPKPQITVGAAAENPLPVWLLGSSVNSAQRAGALGLPYAFAHQINPTATESALQLYRESFRPSAQLDRPYAVVAAVVIAGESDQQAERLAEPYFVGSILARTMGRLDPWPTPDEAAGHDYTPADREFFRDRVRTQIVGGPETVRSKATELITSVGADELMALTLVYDHDDRVRSYELLAEAVAAAPVERAW
jgi:luciferase family oxidoreductase group 1